MTYSLKYMGFRLRQKTTDGNFFSCYTACVTYCPICSGHGPVRGGGRCACLQPVCLISGWRFLIWSVLNMTGIEYDWY